jgi:hypothetical protein
LKIDERVQKFTSYDNPISEKFSGTDPYILRMQCLIEVDDPVVNRSTPVLDVQVIDIWILCKILLDITQFTHPLFSAVFRHFAPQRNKKLAPL